jgi:hypothetical protein
MLVMDVVNRARRIPSGRQTTVLKFDISRRVTAMKLFLKSLALVLALGAASSMQAIDEPPSLSGYVYHDVNNNGIKEGGEAGISNVTVTLIWAGLDDIFGPGGDNDDESLGTTTDTNGFYSFTNLPFGTFVIKETQPPGYLDGKDTIGSQGGTTLNDAFTNIVLNTSIHGTNNNFGEVKPVCPNDVVIDCGDSLAPNNTGAPTAAGSESCSPVSFTHSDSDALGTCAGNHVITRTWMATDSCGNTSTCTQTITVTDTHPPTLSCPANVTIDCTASTLPADTGTATATDDCSGVKSITHSDSDAPGNCPGNHVITRTWTAEDNCGNKSTCTQTITVTDSHAPIITCPANVMIDCAASILPADTGTATATDDCSGVKSITYSDSNAPGNCPGNHVITRTWTAEDNCGNMSTCTQTITVTDSHAPVISCPANVTLDCAASTLPANTGTATATDDCSGVKSITHSDSNAPGNCPGNHVITRTWTAEDNCGNRSTCTQTITVTDSHAPIISCPANVTLDCAASTLPANTGTATATDDCSGVKSITHSDSDALGNCPGNHVITRTWTAEDNCGNKSTCTQTITVTDTTPPTLNCPANVTIDCAASILPANTGTATATDDCSGVKSITHSDSDALGNCPGNHVITRTWTAEDKCGNKSTCVQTITVQDTTPPTITCSPNKTVQCPAAWSFNEPTATDNCTASPTLTHSDSTNVNGSGETVITRTWTATDACGNPARCSQTVTIRPCPPLTLACPASSGQVGVPYSSALVASGGVPPYTFSITAGSLPVGLTLNPTTGAITGVPTEAGHFGFTAQVVDSTGTAAGTASANCSITIIGVGGCRVTGGSNRETNSYQAPCITSALPTHISHGGQVGAAFSVETPFSPNSACISGEWQHNRHLKGNSLVGNFHAAGNGNVHQFDSLLCACLPCAEDLNAVGVVGGVCNPGNRICGPEPRRAPANKICFSGVGDYTFTTGNKTVKAVFRVDIEDRSEGNSQASSPPPDRYRIRLWILDASCGRNPDPNSPEAMAIRFAASADPDKIASLATTEDLKVNIPPDIDDGGNLTQGNHQIHPETGAQCGALTPTPIARIDVSAQVACPTPAGVCTFGVLAQGYEGSTDPVFVYRTTISNPGLVTLTDLSVLETTGAIMSNTTSKYFSPGATLPPGGSFTKYSTNICTMDTVKMITVSGKSSQDGKSLFAGGTAMALVAITQPTGLKATPANAKVSLSWNALSGATYNVKRSMTRGGPYVTIKSGLTTTNYTDATVANGTVYFYAVSATKSAVETPNSMSVSAIPSAGLPSPWSARDIGVVGETGGASYSSSKFTVIGSGADIWDAADEFQYVYQTASGDCSIIARVVSVGNSDPWAKAGIMIRETLADGSKHAAMLVTPGNGVAAQARISTGGSSVNFNVTGLAAPYWLKGVRTGSTFKAYYSSNGKTWTQVASQSILMSSSVYIGLAVTSHNDGEFCTAVFDNVTASP